MNEESQILFSNLTTLGLEFPKGDSLVEPLFGNIIDRYREPWRHYHTFGHIDSLLALVTDGRDQINNIEAVFWSVIFHDVIYDPLAPGRNEELSAQLAEAELRKIHLKPKQIERVGSYVRATALHSSEDIDSDLDLFLDADLAILGANPNDYHLYSANIRKEYPGIPDDQYRAGRIKVLNTLLNRAGQEGIYKTEYFANLLGVQAVANMTNEINTLE